MTVRQPKIVILRGNSGSGKSTVAKLLQRKLGRGTMVISQDYVRREMLWARDTPGGPAIGLLKNLVLYGYQNSEVTILEGILTADIYADLFALIRETFGGDIFAYYYDLSFEETLRRHNEKKRSFPEQFANYGETEMRGWWREKDFLSDIEENVFYENVTVEEAVERIVQQMARSDPSGKERPQDDTKGM